MKSRLAILGMLVAGMLLSTTGAGLAVTSFASNDASVAEYGGGGGGGGTKGEGDNGAPNNGGVLGEADDQGTSPQSGENGENGTNGGAGEQALQPARQVETGASGSQLPFTGFLAIPVLLGGVALLTAGLVLRRRTGADLS